MSPFRKTTALMLSAFLSFNAKPILADSSQETHANPNLIHQESYGPVQKNDTLWSIAKLLKNQNESINDVIVELTLANPNSIKTGKKLFVGQYIHRHPAPEKAQKTAHNIEITEQPITTVSETQESTPPLIDLTQEQSEPSTLINTDVELVTTNEKTIEASTIALTVLTIIILGLFLGLPIIKRKRQQQKIVQDEINKTNTLKRESIKNRLKTTSVMELS